MVLEEIAGLVGSSHLLSRDELAGRPRDFWTKEPTRALALVRPGSVAEISRVLALCNARGQKVIPEGGRTNLVHGTQAAGDEILLSLERLSAIAEPDVKSATVMAEAGATVQRIQERSEAAGLRFGLDFGARGSATLGGALATNAGGLQALRYGIARGQVAGLEAVLADGTVLSHLTPFTKDNTGYDLKQLFIGSEGTLGVITRAVLHLNPLPVGADTALLAFDDFGAVAALLGTLRGALAGTLSSFEIMWGEFFDFNTGEQGVATAPLARGHPYYVLCEAEGFDPPRDRQRFETLIADACTQGGARDAVIAQSERERREIWNIRENFDAEIRLFDTLIDYDVSFPIDAMEPFAEAVRRELQAKAPQNLGLHIMGHLGDGNLHLSTGVPEPEMKPAIDDLIYGLIAAHGGAISAEHGIGITKKRFLRYSRSPGELALMQRLKAALDPENILNPGKVIDMARPGAPGGRKAQ